MKIYCLFNDNQLGSSLKYCKIFINIIFLILSFNFPHENFQIYNLSKFWVKCHDNAAFYDLNPCHWHYHICIFWEYYFLCQIFINRYEHRQKRQILVSSSIEIFIKCIFIMMMMMMMIVYETNVWPRNQSLQIIFYESASLYVCKT